MNVGPATADRVRLLMVVLSVVALVVTGVVVGLEGQRQYRIQATGAAEGQARVLAQTVSAALSFGDADALQDYVDALGADQTVDAVGVFDGRGRLAAGFTRSRLADRLELTKRGARDGDPIVVFAPVLQKGVQLGTVYLRDRTEPLERQVARFVGAALLAMMACLMFLIMAADSRRLRRANQGLIVQMREREKAEAALRQSQKMEAVGRLTGGISHDFNNMLAVVIGSLDLLLRRHLSGDGNAARLARNALDGAKRAADLTQRLMAFSRLQPLRPSAVDVAVIVEGMADMLRRTLGETIFVETLGEADAWRARVDPAQLESAILNLAINARDAMPSGGRLVIETGVVYLDQASVDGDDDVTPGSYVMVAVTDTGSGMAPDVAAKAFEPFFTTKPPGLGTGLGLSQVHGFIRQSGGHVGIHSEVGEGTTVRLYLPPAAAEAQEAAAVTAGQPPGGRRGVTVLLVEDEAGVREFAEEALSELGYEVVSASAAQEALTILEGRADIELVLTDVVMPGMNGAELARRAVGGAPDLRVVYMTGYSRDAIIHNGALDSHIHLVSKPFTMSQLGAEVEAALAGPPAGAAEQEGERAR